MPLVLSTRLLRVVLPLRLAYISLYCIAQYTLRYIFTLLPMLLELHHCYYMYRTCMINPLHWLPNHIYMFDNQSYVISDSLFTPTCSNEIRLFTLLTTATLLLHHRLSQGKLPWFCHTLFPYSANTVFVRETSQSLYKC